MTLVCEPDELSTVLPKFKSALRGFEYNAGQRYAEYRSGDRTSELGLSALIVGGAAAAAVKTGAWKGLWKGILIIVAAIGGIFKKLFGKGGKKSMTDGEQLFCILSLIYLSGCFVWVDRRMMLFSSWLGGEWKAVVSDYRWGNSSGRIYLLNPLPALGFSFPVRLLPISISPSAVVAYNVQIIGNSGRPRQSKRLVSFSSATQFKRIGSELWADEEILADIGDVCTAHELVVLLNRIKNLDDMEARSRMIDDFWMKRLNVHRTKKIIKHEITLTRFLSIFCLVAFLLLFGLVPVLGDIYNNSGVAVLAGAGLMIAYVPVICSIYYRCHKRFYPLFKIGFWGELVKMLFCPPTALRACDLIAGKFSRGLDILPMAALLLRSGERKDFLNCYLADLNSPKFPKTLANDIREICIWQNQSILKTSLSVMPNLKRFIHQPESKAACAAQ